MSDISSGYNAGTLAGGIIGGFVGGLIWGALAICALKRGKPQETNAPFQSFLETSKGWYVSPEFETDGRNGGRNVTTGGRLDGGRKSMDVESGGRLHEGEEDEMLDDNASTRGARLGHEQKRPSINASSEQLDQVTEHQVTEK
jgi:hypothetical protein